MVRMKGMDSAHASAAKPLDGNTVEAAIHAVFMAEFTGRKTPPALESYELIKVKVTIRLPQ